MKKLWITILSLCATILLAGCGVYVPPSKDSTSGNNGQEHYGDSNGGSGGNQGSGGQGSGGTGGDGTTQPSGNAFTVTMTLNGATYTKTNGIKAIWSNRYGTYDADFVNGVASITGLDGEYHVTLSAVPTDADYTYDRSGVYATNKKRNVEIELLQVLKTSTGSNGWQKLNQMGTYRILASSKAPSRPTHYFEPVGPGWYSITSWVDTSDNYINPSLITYNGNPASGFYTQSAVITSGGSEGTYTKNFRYEYKIYDAEVGNAQLFAVMATNTKGLSSVSIEFTVKYEGEYLNPYQGDPVYAEGPFDKDFKNKTQTGSWHYIYENQRNSRGAYILKESLVRFNEADSFYHLYDATKYASTNGYGPVLCTKISKDSQVLLTYDTASGAHIDGGLNWNSINGGMVSCVVDGDDYAYMISDSKRDGEDSYGYAHYCNSDGVHPVTKELKEFLMLYAQRERFFEDGEGWAEIDVGLGENPPGKLAMLDSDEDSQWLFGCGYYE